MRRLFVAAAGFVTVTVTTAGAGAQFTVFDASAIIQTTATALSTAETVVNTLKQVELMRQTLATLDPTSFSGLQGLLGQGQLSYQTLKNDIDAMGFAIADVNRDFDRLFPKDKTAWKNVRYSDYDSYYGRWNAEITGSAKLAERAQSTVLVVEKNNKAIADILAQSTTANGEVRQLQLINQQLALIHSELGALVQSLGSMGRIMSNMAASSAGEKLLLREAKIRRRDGYTNRGRPARTLRRLP
jgi:P-type conjugative transfer protein TrbJ